MSPFIFLLSGLLTTVKSCSLHCLFSYKRTFVFSAVTWSVLWVLQSSSQVFPLCQACSTHLQVGSSECFRAVLFKDFLEQCLYSVAPHCPRHVCNLSYRRAECTCLCFCLVGLLESLGGGIRVSLKEFSIFCHPPLTNAHSWMYHKLTDVIGSTPILNETEASLVVSDSEWHCAE